MVAAGKNSSPGSRRSSEIQDGGEDGAEETLIRLAAQLEAMELVLTAKVGEENRIFGTITSAQIAEALAGQGVTMDRRKIELDEDVVFEAAEATRCAIEVNSHLDRLDAPAEVLRRAMGRDVLFAVSTDAHDVRELGNRVWGVKQARRGWVTRDRVVNTWERDRFMAWLEETRSFG